MSTDRTRSGIYMRSGELAIIVYSPYTGSFFAIDPRYERILREWLRGNEVDVPSEIAAALGPGWVGDVAGDPPSGRHVLPKDDWGFMNGLDGPLVINWLITGNCAYDCPYCYAKDLMNGRCKEPKQEDVEEIAAKILSYEPMAVVLTGGDPLLSPHLGLAMELIHRKAGVIVDTSGFAMTDEHIGLFRRYGAFLRVSLDSEVSSRSAELRPMKGTKHGDTGAIALKTILTGLSHGVHLGVQTVVTAVNYYDLESLGIKLQRLGVRNWRLMLLACTRENQEVLRRLRFTKTNDKRFRSNIWPAIKCGIALPKEGAMSVRLAENDVPNAVILVSPDGMFYTESADGTGKRAIDLSNIKSPRRSAMAASVDMHAHARRYLCE